MRRLLTLLCLIGIGVVAFLACTRGAQDIESRLAVETRDALDRGGHEDVDFTIDGRLVELAASATEGPDARRAARTVDGLLRVTVTTDPADSSAESTVDTNDGDGDTATDDSTGEQDPAAADTEDAESTSADEDADSAAPDDEAGESTSTVDDQAADDEAADEPSDASEDAEDAAEPTVDDQAAEDAEEPADEDADPEADGASADGDEPAAADDEAEDPAAEDADAGTTDEAASPDAASDDLQASLDDVLARARLEGATFPSRGATFDDATNTALDEVAILLAAHPDAVIEVGGHTDANGSSGANQELSLARATAVQTALTERGVDAERLQTMGYGEFYPIADNTTYAGQTENRRVELTVLSGEDQP